MRPDSPVVTPPSLSRGHPPVSPHLSPVAGIEAVPVYSPDLSIPDRRASWGKKEQMGKTGSPNQKGIATACKE